VIVADAIAADSEGHGRRRRLGPAPLDAVGGNSQGTTKGKTIRRLRHNWTFPQAPCTDLSCTALERTAAFAMSAHPPTRWKST
jgi:hypothetical protein